MKKKSTTETLPRGGHPQKVSEEVRRALDREAAKRSRVNLKELTDPQLRWDEW